MLEQDFLQFWNNIFLQILSILTRSNKIVYNVGSLIYNFLQWNKIFSQVHKSIVAILNAKTRHFSSVLAFFDILIHLSPPHVFRIQRLKKLTNKISQVDPISKSKSSTFFLHQNKNLHPHILLSQTM